MKRWIKLLAEIGFILITIALMKVYRATWIGVFIPVFFIVLLEINDRTKKNHIVNTVCLTGLVAFSFWLFNDLMAVGKFSAIIGKIALLNYLLYLMPFVLFIVLNKNLKVAFVCPSALFTVVGLANLIVKAVRRTPISAGDIYSIKTAFAVAGNYNMEFDTEFILKAGLGISILILTLIIAHGYLKDEYKRNKCNIVTRVTLGTVSLAWIIVVLASSIVVNISGRVPDYFTHETNGFALNLYLQWKDITIKEPEEYNVDILTNIEEENPSDKANSVDKSLPNVIAIMNESFADLTVLGEYDTNIEVLPFLNSLSENTIKGTALSSVYGGNTANSEYEFLTGCSQAYFSERVVPYQLFMNEERPSLISQMKDIGYYTVFMHPYRSYSWNRPSVYTAFGVDEMIFEEDMTDLSYIRAYASDASQYEYIKKYLESDRDKPLFLFDVTVQNHGGYTGTVDQLPEKITVTGHEGEFVEAENYLTLSHESDKALEKIITYLQNYKEPTVVVFFGDHQPSIDTAFIENAIKKSKSQFTREDFKKMYKVPFFIWANYDIEEETIDEMSLNYLSTLMCEKIGLPMTGLQKYLQKQRVVMPSISTVNIPDTDIKDTYMKLIYNYMFDKENRLTKLYKLQ